MTIDSVRAQLIQAHLFDRRVVLQLLLQTQEDHAIHSLIEDPAQFKQIIYLDGD